MRIILFGVPSVLASICAVFLAGCTDDSAQLQKQNDLLRLKLEETESALESSKLKLKALEQAQSAAGNAAQLAELRAQLSTAQQKIGEMEKLASSGGLKSDSLISEDKLRSNYEAATRILEREISSNPSYKVESWTIHKIDYPQQMEWPFRSKITVNLETQNGSMLSLTAPVMADLKGVWKFPSFQQLLSSQGSVSTLPASSNQVFPQNASERPSPSPVEQGKPSPVSSPAPVKAESAAPGRRRSSSSDVIDIPLPPSSR
jgi:hypothetical protein